MATQVAFSNLDTWLSNQPDNTVNTPYELKITGLTANDIASSRTAGTLGYILKQHSTIYVDLSETELPSVTDLQQLFDNCTTLVRASEIPNTVTSMFGTFRYCTSLISSPTIPSSVTYMGATFWGCSSLTSAPEIPSSVTSMTATFKSCTSLVNAPVIPEGVTSMDSAFKACNNLSYKPIIPSTVTSSTDCYSSVTTNNWKGTVSQVEDYATTLKSLSQSNSFEVQVYDTDRTTLLNSVNWVSFSNLNSWLQLQAVNTTSSPYELNITYLTSNNIGNSSTNGTLGYILNQNNTKYVDLRETATPTVTSGYADKYWYAFENCTSLVYPPQLPNQNNQEASFRATFKGCSSLKEPPNLSNANYNGFISMFENCISLEIDTSFVLPRGDGSRAKMFKGCVLIEQMPNIYYENTNSYYYDANFTSMFEDCIMLKNLDGLTVKNSADVILDNMFKGCVQLEDVGSFSITPHSSDYRCSMVSCFEGCESLLNGPEIPDNVTAINGAFKNCTNLTTPPVLGNGILYMQDAFSGCSSLSVAPVIPNGCEYIDRAFRQTAITEVPVLPNSISSCSEAFGECKNITSTGQLNHLTSASNFNAMFSGCTNLVSVSELPNSAEYLYGMFRRTKITELPIIPEGALDIGSICYNCTSLTTVRYIPSTITKAKSAFENCASLTKIKELHVPVATLRSSTNFQDMFKNCDSLTQIGYKSDSDQWHAFRLKFGASSVEGKVFDKDGVGVSIPSTSITKDTVNMPVLTDELWFPPSNMSDVDIETLINKVISNRYTYWKKSVVDPTHKSFVLWADDENYVVTNVVGGGGGGGIEKEVISTTSTKTITKDTRIFANGSGITITLSHGSTENCLVEVFAIQACTITYYTAQSTTASLSMAANTSAVFIYFSGWKYCGIYGAVWN